jgi:hypothetical protein
MFSANAASPSPLTLTDNDSDAMPTYLTLPMITAAAGILAGAGFPAFAAAALGAAAAVWFARLKHSGGFYLHVTLDPDAPDNGMLAEALRAAVRQLQHTQSSVTLRIAALRASPHPRINLNLTRDGDLEVLCDRKRPCALGHPGLWIADHPLPLCIPHMRSITLHLTPAVRERLRVTCDSAASVTRNGWIAILLIVTAACAFDLSGLLATALGFAGQAYLLEHHPERPRRQRKVKPH